MNVISLLVSLYFVFYFCDNAFDHHNRNGLKIIYEGQPISKEKNAFILKLLFVYFMLIFLFLKISLWKSRALL